VTAGKDAGLLVRVNAKDIPAGTSLAWGFGGADGEKGRRRGDIGCERQPVSKLFDVSGEKCVGNAYTLLTSSATGAALPACQMHSTVADLLLTFPAGARLSVEEFGAWKQPPVIQRTPNATAAAQPVLMGSAALGDGTMYLTVERGTVALPILVRAAEVEFAERSAELDKLASRLTVDTPDAYLNAAIPAMNVAADALWDAKLGCVMHGAVAWRNPLVGWRGPYIFDSVGDHATTRTNLRHWLAKQNLQPVTGGDPARGPYDSGQHLARKEGMLHSNGDLSGNHYDMNMVFMDVMLRHLRWTGDLTFAKEVWPAFHRHLAWERRMFRREYMLGDGRKLPLYEAYAAIWASDNLQYNGGGTAHSSAYNVFALRAAAELATLLGEDPAEYTHEASLLQQGMKELLWLPTQGAYAESKDILGPQTVYNNPALWTVYHTVDSEVPDARQAWQMVAERLHTLLRVPVHGDDVPAGSWYMLSCSDWLPYQWSLNLLVLAENTHMALAMWQAGMADDAYALLKGNLLDSMYQGLCPGDFHMSSELDVHRQEAQRDFGDPIGITSRAIVEGLFGVRPNLLAGEIVLQPGFPSEWDHASMHHKDFDLTWKREGMKETLSFTSRFPTEVKVKLRLPAKTAKLRKTDGGVVAFDAGAVGRPMVAATLPASFVLELEWSGSAPTSMPPHRHYRIGETVALPQGATLDDPQMSLLHGKAAVAGVHTVFAEMHEGDATWSMPISFTVEAAEKFAAVPAVKSGTRLETVTLEGMLDSRLQTIFTRLYVEPRSEFCSLAIPDTLLGGWAEEGAAFPIDDSGLRGAGGELKTSIGVPFATPAGDAPNCRFLSYFKPDGTSLNIPLSGRAKGVYLLMTGTTLPQCSRMDHAKVSVSYGDGSAATLALRNPETWWPIEQDYLLDDYLFVNEAPLPPRVDLRSGQTRLLDPMSFKGKGRRVPGGAATVYHLPLDAGKDLKELKIEVLLYGIVVGVLAATLDRG
jgi:hypothetical protein